MKLYLIKHDESGFTGLCDHFVCGFIFSIETNHFHDTVNYLLEMKVIDFFEENGITFFDAQPNTLLSIIRDFLWNKFREQGFIEENAVNPDY